MSYVIDSYSVDDMEDKDSIIRIQWKEGGIKCPVSQCSVTFCTSKQTFARHWEETHREWNNYQICPKCGIELRRFIELQQHMRHKHGFQDKDFSAILPSVKVIRKINVKYIDPGPYRPPIFHSASNKQSSIIKMLKSSNSTNNGSTHKKSSSSKDSRSPTKSHSSLLSKRKSSSSSTHATAVIKPKVQKKHENNKNEGRSSSSKLPTWSVPDIPSGRQLLVDYLKWADSVICQVGNARLEAKRRLDALDVDSELQKERQLRKKIEKELESTKAELEALRHLSDYTSFSLS